MQANIDLKIEYRASRWHQRCRWANRDYGMSPFRGQLSGKLLLTITH